jgi:hypothetical protein
VIGASPFGSIRDSYLRPDIGEAAGTESAQRPAN